MNPGATEVYNQLDDDCDGAVDEEFSAYYGDVDADGFGAGAAMYATSAPIGHVTDSTDCDDTRASVNLGATEAYNKLDDDCDGFVDVGFATSSAPSIRNAATGAPGTPLTGTARWSAPSNDGGSDVIRYVVQAQTLGKVVRRINKVVGPSTRTLVVKLAAGRDKFRVSAVNVVGQSAWSHSSNIVRAR